MATVKLDPAKGIQIPNLTTTERNAISSPETGAIIWNTTTSEINQYNGSAWEITYTPVAGITSSADATAITIDSSENVGIGGTPSTLLHLKSTSADTPILRIQNTLNHGVDDDPAIEFYADDTNQSGIADNTNIGTIRFKGDDKDGGSNHDYAEIIGVMADPGGTYRGAINFKIANGSAPATITRIDKDGLKFGSDTASANALDDYEEGTHTVTVTMGTGSAVLHTSHRTFQYTKIGRVVHVSGQVLIDSASNPDGEFQMSLPFTVGNGSSFYSVGNYRTYNVDTPNDGVQAVVFANSNEAKCIFAWSRDSATSTNERATVNGFYMIGLTYMT